MQNIKYDVKVENIRLIARLNKINFYMGKQ